MQTNQPVFHLSHSLTNPARRVLYPYTGTLNALAATQSKPVGLPQVDEQLRVRDLPHAAVQTSPHLPLESDRPIPRHGLIVVLDRGEGRENAVLGRDDQHIHVPWPSPLAH